MLADGALQMHTVVDARGHVVAGFRNIQGGSNFNVVAPASKVSTGCFTFQGGTETIMAALEAVLSHGEPQSTAQASPDADGGQATAREETTAPGKDTDPEQQGWRVWRWA